MRLHEALIVMGTLLLMAWVMLLCEKEKEELFRTNAELRKELREARTAYHEQGEIHEEQLRSLGALREQVKEDAP